MEKTKHFLKGVEDYRTGNIPLKNKKTYWVKKTISKKAWNEIYSKDNSYCLLNKKGDDVEVGFCCAILDGYVSHLDNNEIRQVGGYRKANNIYPQPLEDYTPPTDEINVNELDL